MQEAGLHSSPYLKHMNFVSRHVMERQFSMNQPMDDNQTPTGQDDDQVDHTAFNLDPQIQAEIIQQISLQVRNQFAAQFAAGFPIPAAPGIPAAAGAPPAGQQAPTSMLVPDAAPLRIPNFNWGNATSGSEKQTAVSMSYPKSVDLNSIFPCCSDTVPIIPNGVANYSPVNVVRQSLYGNGNKICNGKSPVCDNGAQPDITNHHQVVVSSDSPPDMTELQNNGTPLTPREAARHDKNRAKIRNKSECITKTRINVKRARASSPNKSDETTITSNSIQNCKKPARKKRRLIDNEVRENSIQLRQVKIDTYFTKDRVDVPDTQDRINLDNLLALDTLPSSPIQDSDEGETGQNDEVPLPSQGKMHDLYEREPILFSRSEDSENIWVLDVNDTSESSKLLRLISRLRKHDQDILERSVLRAESQLAVQPGLGGQFALSHHHQDITDDP